MGNRHRIRGSVTIRVPFTWSGEVHEDDLEKLSDWEALASSGMVEDAIQQAIADGNFDVDENDIEIDSVKEIIGGDDEAGRRA